ncbi:MAG: hypothetical protein ACQETE_08640 [Bacteroidota bacterium]|jgi:Ca2+/H+ antiporter
MIILLGIIILHITVVLRAKLSHKEGVPYVSSIVFTMMLVGYVVYMVFTMQPPTP